MKALSCQVLMIQGKAVSVSFLVDIWFELVKKNPYYEFNTEFVPNVKGQKCIH